MRNWFLLSWDLLDVGGPTHSDQFEKVVREGWRAIRRVAAQRGVGFAAMGISQDAWPEQGIEYLKKFGKFDEISVGRGWRNAGILKYIYGDFPGRAATPQVLVLDRALVHEGGQWTLESERVLIRKIGIAEMDRWIEGGRKLPENRRRTTERIIRYRLHRMRVASRPAALMTATVVFSGFPACEDRHSTADGFLSEIPSENRDSASVRVRECGAWMSETTSGT